MKLPSILLDDPKQRSSIKTHMSVFQVTNKTAIKDLKELLAEGLLVARKKAEQSIITYQGKQRNYLLRHNIVIKSIFINLAKHTILKLSLLATFCH